MIVNVSIPIPALQWTGFNNEECKNFVGDGIEFIYPTMDQSVVFATICTKMGELTLSIGDYIIQGVDGEFYPCKKEIFERIKMCNR